jgi:hypothetical protein
VTRYHSNFQPCTGRIYGLNSQVGSPPSEQLVPWCCPNVIPSSLSTAQFPCSGNVLIAWQLSDRCQGAERLLRFTRLRSTSSFPSLLCSESLVSAICTTSLMPRRLRPRDPWNSSTYPCRCSGHHLAADHGCSSILILLETSAYHCGDRVCYTQVWKIDSE